jgi:hypothetical protein
MGMVECTCDGSGALDGHAYHCDLRRANRVTANRVLVDLPERLRKAKEATGTYEKQLEDIRTVYRQRSILKDSVVLDHIGELLGESI